jgi:hypothetical protein
MLPGAPPAAGLRVWLALLLLAMLLPPSPLLLLLLQHAP